ncbi:MAG TPA: signal peptidase I [Candidatus Binatia bacterium]|nr:signal peptidase I [Candidatus Binatia bacterium]
MAKKENSVETNPSEVKPKETTVEFLASLAAVLVTGLFIITFVVQAFEIPSSSMEDTLLIGDHVFVNRVQFAPSTKWIGPLIPYRDVHFRDIVVFLSPETPGLYVVKRIIGVPGDRIHLRNGVVYRNGAALDEPYVDHDDDRTDPYRNEYPAVPPDSDPNVWTNWAIDLNSYIQGDDIVVPPNHYFAMGDHGGVSLDSRYWGFIPKDNIIGRPMFIYWSFTTPPDQYLKTSAGDRVKFFLGQVVLHFFDKTKWKRTLQVVR